MLAAIVAFAAIGITELNLLLRTFDENSVSQNRVIKEESETIMWDVLVYQVLLTIEFAADGTDDQFGDMLNDYDMLAEQVTDVLRHPDNYTEANLLPPQKGGTGKYAPQLLYSEWADRTDEDNLSTARKLANLAPLMEQILNANNGFTNNCYIALPCGISIAYDDMPDDKLDADGKPLYYDATQRGWYLGATESGETFITPVVDSYFHDTTGLGFGIPLYDNGELIAVLHGFTKLDTLRERASEITDIASDFTLLVSGEGQIIYSSCPSGELAMTDNLSIDIRDTTDPEIKKLINEALSLETDYCIVTIEGRDYYASYAPIKTLGWSQIMFIPKQDLDYVSQELLERMDEVRDEFYESFSMRFSRAFKVILAVTAALIAGAVILSLFFSKKLIEPVDIMTERVKNMTGDDMDFEMDSAYKTGDEIEVLAGSFSALTDKLKTYISEITEMSAEKERIDAEMAAANRIQSSMVPHKFPERSEFDLYAEMIPAKDVGGDLYDFYFIDDDRLVLVIGDVSGKGVTAALFMVMAKQVIKSEIMRHDGDVEKTIESVNATLYEDNSARMFITVWLGVLTLSTGHLTYTNAGHEYPIIYRNGSEYKVFKDNHTTPVACRKRFSAELNELDLEPGDALYLYTDGLTEADNEDQQMFGRDRLEEVLNLNKDADLKTLDDSVRCAIKEFVGDAEQFDDMTTLCIRYKGPDAGSEA